MELLQLLKATEASGRLKSGSLFLIPAASSKTKRPGLESEDIDLNRWLEC